jgi:uncharacterized tellurite resistance protein B-like protein
VTNVTKKLEVSLSSFN